MKTPTGSSKHSTSRREPEPDAQEISRALAQLHKPGEVFEIRALGEGRGWPRSGYFNDYAKATQAALSA